MNRTIKFAGILAAICTSIAAMPAADALTLYSNPGDSFSSYTNAGADAPYLQPLATISVSSNTLIGGFGVSGQAFGTTNLKWLIFEGDDLKYNVDQIVGTQSGWFYSPSIDGNFTLEVGKTYAM